MYIHPVDYQPLFIDSGLIFKFFSDADFIISPMYSFLPVRVLTDILFM